MISVTTRILDSVIKVLKLQLHFPDHFITWVRKCKYYRHT